MPLSKCLSGSKIFMTKFVTCVMSRIAEDSNKNFSASQHAKKLMN